MFVSCDEFSDAGERHKKELLEKDAEISYLKAEVSALREAANHEENRTLAPSNKRRLSQKRLLNPSE